MRKIMTVCCLLITIQAFAGKLEKDLPGVWNVVKIETSDEMIDGMIKSLIGDKYKDLIVEFTKTGMVKIAGRETGTKYVVNKEMIKLSQGLAEKLKNPEVKARSKKDELTVDISPELAKQIFLMAKDMYLKSGGEALVAAMMENVALNSGIKGVITLKRKK